MKPFSFKKIVGFAVCCCAFLATFGQAEIEPWGNLSGIRIKGQLMEAETALCVVKKYWSSIVSTGKERQRPKYVRKGRQQIVTTTIDSLYFTETLEDAGAGAATLNVQVQSRSDETVTGVFLRLSLPSRYYAKGTLQVAEQKPVPLSTDAALTASLQSPVRSLKFGSLQRQLLLTFAEPVNIFTRPSSNEERIEFYIPLKTGSVTNGETLTKTVSFKASGTVDNKPIILTLNTSATGRSFDGLGGNFRLQNPRTDPQVIDYCLQNLRVAWSRVEMPWRFWQPTKDSNPIDSAKAGRLHPAVKAAMQMAQRLSKMNIPVVLSAWSAPAWAIVGPPRFRPGADGVWGNALNQDSATEIYRSIADYVVYLKEAYGVEVVAFSFNESDLGINVRQTAEEHAALIKGLGAAFERGLKTKLLLGDNSDATTYKFIDVALADASTHPYIAAVSFHSWRGWERETLQHWADAATKLNLPLLVAEGSIDAQAWGYPLIFEEPTYALQEINLYTRLLSICQPASILQWQLTADYSPLSGGGIFGDNTPLRPTQRFWNLKQLASTPQGLKAMNLTSGAENFSCAALGDAAKGVYAFHLVNSGATRQVLLTGLPKKLKALQLYVTDAKRAMQKGKAITAVNGRAKFTVDETSYTTLIAE